LQKSLQLFSIGKQVFGHNAAVKEAEAVKNSESQNIVEEKEFEGQLETKNQLIYCNEN